MHLEDTYRMVSTSNMISKRLQVSGNLNAKMLNTEH